MFNLKEYRGSTTRLPDYLPWGALIAPGVVLQKNAVLQKTISFRGPDLGSSSESELVGTIARLNNALKRLGSGWAIFIEAQRFVSPDYPEGQWKYPAAQLIDLERQNMFADEGTHFESLYYLTFTKELPSMTGGRIADLFYDDPEEKDDVQENEKELGLFVKEVLDVVDIMSGVFNDVHELDDNETLTFLHSTISSKRHAVKAPETPMYLDALLPDQALTIGDFPMLGETFMPTVTINGFPAESFPGILDALNYLGIEYRWVVRYIFLDKTDARKELERYRKQWWSKRKNIFTLLKEEATKEPSALVDNDAANKAADADAALQELGDDLVAFGYMTATVTVSHTDISEALRRIREVKRVVQSNGFTVMDETLNAFQAWLGSLPGNVYPNVRRPMMSTLNLAHIMPVSAVWAGDEENKHLKEVTGVGIPHMQCTTSGNTPFRLNLNVGDVGHTLIIGPTGAGKSTLLAMLELQWLKYPDAQVVIFDKDRSARAATLGIGGSYYEPGGENAPLAFQPLSEIDNPQDRIWAAEFISLLIGEQGVNVNPSTRKQIDEALETLAEQDGDHRTLTVFTDYVQSNEVRDAIRPYTVVGNYGQLFDADMDTMTGGFWQMIEMGSLMSMSKEAIIPALFYLFHRVEKLFDGRPTLLVLDEAWMFLKHPVFMNQLQNWLKTLRKKNVYVVFATQEVTDAADSPIMATILSACHTKIYLPDEEALAPGMAQAYRNFGLTDTEITILTRVQKKRDYYYRSSRGRRMFSMNLGPIALAFAGMSSPADQVFLDSIAGLPKETIVPAILRHQGLDWAIELLDNLQFITR